MWMWRSRKRQQWGEGRESSCESKVLKSRVQLSQEKYSLPTSDCKKGRNRDGINRPCLRRGADLVVSILFRLGLRSIEGRCSYNIIAYDDLDYHV